ncbi:SURF1-domain-containing protein [Trametes punicea]|nr:SURF1-domain-containing protein [Trametes punicea]
MLRSWTSTLARPRLATLNVRRNLIRRPERRVSTEGASQTYRAKREPLFTPFMVLVGTIPIFTFALGTWQVQRLKWKIALIDDLEEKLEREPLPLPPRINLEALPDFQFRKVILKGRWDNAHCILLGPRVRDGTIGYHLIVPFVRTDGSTVLVDRGFVSRELAQTARRIQDQERGEVEILGMLRTAQGRNAFTPDNNPQKGEWYWADVGALAEHAGGEAADVQPAFIEEVFEGHAGEASLRLSHGLPVGRPPTVDVRNSHVSYIVTWYSLSAFTTVMFIRLLLKRRQALARLPR